MAITRDLIVQGSARFLKDVWGVTFHGDLDGNATSANSADKVKTVSNITNAATYYLTFVDSNNTNPLEESVFTTAKLAINPSTGTVFINNGTTSIGADNTSTIWLKNSSGIPLVAESNVVRRGASLTTGQLGSTTYPWAGVYTKYVWIDSNSAGATAHINFNRTNYNYLTIPTGGTLAVSVNGSSGANTRLGVDNTSVFPGMNNNTIDLGTSDYHWKTGYINHIVTQNYGIKENSDNRLCFGNATIRSAKGISIKDLLVSDTWSDVSYVPTNGIYSKGRIKSGVAQGTAPFDITSTTLNSNLNADLLDGKNADEFLYRLRRLNETFGSSSLSSGMFPPALFELKNAGYPIYSDPQFASGTNSVNIYNNKSNGTVTITRQADDQGSGNSSGYILKITTNGEATPGTGGFYQSINSRANAIFVQIFRAKIPVGYSVTTASNSMGTGYQDKFITNTAGTGKWEWYARVVYCGSTGTLSSGGHVYLTASSGYSSTSVTWYLSYCNAIDITNSEYDGLRTRLSDESLFLRGNALRVASITTQTSQRTIYCKIASISYADSGMLYISVNGNSLLDHIYVNYGSGNAEHPVICGWKDSNSENVSAIYAVKSNAWDGSWELWIKVKQLTDCSIAVSRYWGIFTVNNDTNWSATTTEPSYDSKYEVTRGPFGYVGGSGSTLKQYSTNNNSTYYLLMSRINSNNVDLPATYVTEGANFTFNPSTKQLNIGQAGTGSIVIGGDAKLSANADNLVLTSDNTIITYTDTILINRYSASNRDKAGEKISFYSNYAYIAHFNETYHADESVDPGHMTLYAENILHLNTSCEYDDENGQESLVKSNTYILAEGFKHSAVDYGDGESDGDDYVLLAGGGIKPLSEFGSGTASGNYLPLSGGTMTDNTAKINFIDSERYIVGDTRTITGPLISDTRKQIKYHAREHWFGPGTSGGYTQFWFDGTTAGSSFYIGISSRANASINAYPIITQQDLGTQVNSSLSLTAATTGSYYPVQYDSNNKLFVRVPGTGGSSSGITSVGQVFSNTSSGTTDYNTTSDVTFSYINLLSDGSLAKSLQFVGGDHIKFKKGNSGKQLIICAYDVGGSGGGSGLSLASNTSSSNYNVPFLNDTDTSNYAYYLNSKFTFNPYTGTLRVQANSGNRGSIYLGDNSEAYISEVSDRGYVEMYGNNEINFITGTGNDYIKFNGTPITQLLNTYTITRNYTSGQKIFTFSYTGGSIDLYAPTSGGTSGISSIEHVFSNTSNGTSNYNTSSDVTSSYINLLADSSFSSSLQFVGGDHIKFKKGNSGKQLIICAYDVGGSGGGISSVSLSNSKFDSTNSYLKIDINNDNTLSATYTIPIMTTSTFGVAKLGAAKDTSVTTTPSKPSGSDYPVFMDNNNKLIVRVPSGGGGLSFASSMDNTAYSLLFVNSSNINNYGYYNSNFTFNPNKGELRIQAASSDYDGNGSIYLGDSDLTYIATGKIGSNSDDDKLLLYGSSGTYIYTSSTGQICVNTTITPYGSNMTGNYYIRTTGAAYFKRTYDITTGSSPTLTTYGNVVTHGNEGNYIDRILVNSAPGTDTHTLYIVP